jgi:hypothetical protein
MADRGAGGGRGGGWRVLRASGAAHLGHLARPVDVGRCHSALAGHIAQESGAPGRGRRARFGGRGWGRRGCKDGRLVGRKEGAGGVTWMAGAVAGDSRGVSKGRRYQRKDVMGEPRWSLSPGTF